MEQPCNFFETRWRVRWNVTRRRPHNELWPCLEEALGSDQRSQNCGTALVVSYFLGLFRPS